MIAVDRVLTRRNLTKPVRAALREFVCLHGIVHSRKEGLATIAWAAKDRRDLDIGDLGIQCWILAYREMMRAAKP